MEKIIIIGMGGHAKSVVDTIERQQQYEVVGCIVNEINDCKLLNKYPIIGGDNDLETIFLSGIENVAIGIGYMGRSALRERLWKILKNIGYHFPVICDPTAVLARDVKLAEGCFVGKGAILNANVSIGRMCIINTGAIIEHDCLVDDFSHISVGSVLCGDVKIGKSVFVGANATVIQGKTIGDRSIIGAGTTVRKNMQSECMVW